MKNKTLVFDFDGTIADTHLFIIEIANRLSDEFHYRKIRPDEIEELKHKTSQEIIKHLGVPVMKIPAILSRAKKEFNKNVATLKPFKGITDVLKQIHKAGIPMGILSSNAAENINAFLANHNLNFFDFIQSTSKVWTKNTSLKAIMKRFGLGSKNILYIGDEVRDIAAAHKLGIDVISVSWGYNSPGTLRANNPSYLVHSPEELLTLCLK